MICIKAMAGYAKDNLAAVPSCGKNPDRRIDMNQPHLHLQADQLYPFDARGIAKRFRHAAIFCALDALFAGETMRFCNDHDPLPLLDQMRARYGGKVEIRYVQREPGAIVIDFVKKQA
jgi:uncharacterized protein (DUF2249 family)